MKKLFVLSLLASLTLTASVVLAEATTTGDINVPAGSYYKYDGYNLAFGQPNLGNYFFGGAGNSTMTGWYNTAIGHQSLVANTSGDSNVANGAFALSVNTTGVGNTASGRNALYRNVTGNANTANGANALYNTIGSSNTANGVDALFVNTTGNDNTAIGAGALYANQSGLGNAALGYESLYSNTTGNYNIGIGYGAGVLSGNLTNATAIGHNAYVGGSNMMVLGGTGGDAVNVGIGTTLPKTSLQVSASTPVSNTVPALGSISNVSSYLTNHDTAYGLLTGVLSNGNAFQQVQRTDGTATAYNLLLQPNGGKVGIGTLSPQTTLDVKGDLSVSTGASYVGKAVCYVTNGKLGHCTSALSSTGACTCVAN